MTATHTVLIPLTMERPLSADEFEELISWAESTGAYNGGLVIINDDYASPMLNKLETDSNLRKDGV